MANDEKNDAGQGAVMPEKPAAPKANKPKAETPPQGVDAETWEKFRAFQQGPKTAEKEQQFIKDMDDLIARAEAAGLKPYQLIGKVYLKRGAGVVDRILGAI